VTEVSEPRVRKIVTLASSSGSKKTPERVRWKTSFAPRPKSAPPVEAPPQGVQGLVSVLATPPKLYSVPLSTAMSGSLEVSAHAEQAHSTPVDQNKPLPRLMSLRQRTFHPATPWRGQNEEENIRDRTFDLSSGLLASTSFAAAEDHTDEMRRDAADVMSQSLKLSAQSEKVHSTPVDQSKPRRPLPRWMSSSQRTIQPATPWRGQNEDEDTREETAAEVDDNDEETEETLRDAAGVEVTLTEEDFEMEEQRAVLEKNVTILFPMEETMQNPQPEEDPENLRAATLDASMTMAVADETWGRLALNVHESTNQAEGKD